MAGEIGRPAGLENMDPIVSNILLILLFILIGGVFAAAEMALVSLRDAQVRQLSHRGKRGATVARLTEDPNRFLSAVQIGVTLSGFLSASFGGAMLEEPLSKVLIGWGVPVGAAAPVSLVLITIVISYFSIVIGELTAKRLAMQRAESFSMALAPLVNSIATLARPVIWFLGVSTNALVRIVGGDPSAAKEEVSDEELRSMVGSSTTLGDEERRIVDEVFAAGDTSLREVMIPRTEVDFLDGDLIAKEAVKLTRDGTHSRYPVIGEDLDDVLGFVHIRDLVDLDQATGSVQLRRLVRPVESLPQSMRVLRALGQMRRSSWHLVIVRDEYGGTAGIVTIEDLVEELVGDITDEFDEAATPSLGGADSTLELDGLTTLNGFAEETGFEIPDGPYDTVAGALMAALGRLPELDDLVEVKLTVVDSEQPPVPFEFRVVEVDGRRAARVRLRRVGGVPEAEVQE